MLFLCLLLQFDELDDAIKALEGTNGKQVRGSLYCTSFSIPHAPHLSQRIALLHARNASSWPYRL